MSNKKTIIKAFLFFTIIGVAVFLITIVSGTDIDEIFSSENLKNIILKFLKNAVSNN